MDYFVAFPANTDRTTNPTLSLLIIGAPGVSGTVACEGLAFSTGYTTDASGLATVSIPPAAMLTQLDSAEDKGIVVHAEDTVSVVAVSDLTGTMGTYTVPPASALGTDYYLASGGATVTTSGGMFLAIAATTDATTVNITPTAVSSGHGAGVPYSIVLDRGQAYQRQADALAGDIAGTRLTSTHPIALYGGHMLGQVPAGTGFASFMASPTPPLSSAGFDFFAVPLATRSGYWIRLLGLHDGTSISYSSAIAGAPASLNAGQVVDFRYTLPVRMTSTASMIVMQMAEGGSVDGETGADPFLSVLVPSTRFAASYDIATPTNQVDSRYVNLVAKTADTGKITIDGTPIGSGNYSQIGTTDYSAASVALDAGCVTIAGGGARFGALTYGWAPADGSNGFAFTPGAGF